MKSLGRKNRTLLCTEEPYPKDLTMPRADRLSTGLNVNFMIRLHTSVGKQTGVRPRLEILHNWEC